LKLFRKLPPPPSCAGVAFRRRIDRPAPETKPARIGDSRIESPFPEKSESILAAQRREESHA
jgi:hypothetical protein